MARRLAPGSARGSDSNGASPARRADGNGSGPARGGEDNAGRSGLLVDWGYTAAGAIYTGWTLSLFLRLRAGDSGLEWALLAVLATFATDTGAFMVGRAIGKRRLAPRISPGKTWEGAIGGWLTAVGSTVGLAALLDLPVTTAQAAALGALVGVAAQAGDLVESALKRSAGVKDSGALIPGHGGALDRLDSVVFAIVVVYHFKVWIAM